MKTRKIRMRSEIRRQTHGGGRTLAPRGPAQLAAAVLTLALTAVPGAWGQEKAPSCPSNAAQVDLTVPPKPWEAGTTIGVAPEQVEIFLPQTPGKAAVVCWMVSGLAEGETLHLKGKEGQEDLFPDLERTIRLPRTFGLSGKPAKLGTWRYELWITQEGSTEIFLKTDPEVIIKSGGGGS